MKFKRKIQSNKKLLGTTKITSWFAWFPVTIDYETRWLETVTVKFEYAVSERNVESGTTFEWEMIAFID